MAAPLPLGVTGHGDAAEVLRLAGVFGENVRYALGADPETNALP
jgi:hypothetical protein